jgi:ATP-dependent protease Clp ATPase subunit
LIDKKEEEEEEEEKSTKNILGTSSPDDDLGAHGSNPNFNTRVPILSQFSSQYLVQFCVENSIRNKL